MAENKTKPTDRSVEDYLASIADEERRQDCQALVRLMRKVTRHKPVMWGPSIVGFGTYHYRYASGREGDFCTTGFSSRKAGISIYLMAEAAGQQERLAKLGRHKMDKSCLHIRRLSEVDRKVLEELITEAVAEVKRRHPFS